MYSSTNESSTSSGLRYAIPNNDFNHRPISDSGSLYSELRPTFWICMSVAKAQCLQTIWPILTWHRNRCFLPLYGLRYLLTRKGQRMDRNHSMHILMVSFIAVIRWIQMSVLAWYLYPSVRVYFSLVIVPLTYWLCKSIKLCSFSLSARHKSG
jgi:hypothetical protein